MTGLENVSGGIIGGLIGGKPDVKGVMNAVSVSLDVFLTQQILFFHPAGQSEGGREELVTEAVRCAGVCPGRD